MFVVPWLFFYYFPVEYDGEDKPNNRNYSRSHKGHCIPDIRNRGSQRKIYTNEDKCHYDILLGSHAVLFVEELLYGILTW